MLLSRRVRWFSLLLFVSCLFVVGCKSGSIETKTPVMGRNQPDETSYNVRLNEYKGDRIDYQIEAEKMLRYYDRRMLYGFKVTLTSYDKENKISSVIKADTTIVDDARNIIFAYGNASYSSEGGGVKTSRIVWERNLDEITAPGKVTLTRNGSVLRGINLRTNSQLSFATMESVSAEGIIDEKDIAW